MIALIVTILFTLILVIIIVGLIVLGKKESYDKISFKEAVDLTGNPIIVFYNGNKKLHFLLDTGATVSMINSNDLVDCNYQKTDIVMDNMGIEGNMTQCDVITMDFQYKNNSFTENLLVGDLSAAFTYMKQTTGVTIHGILGTSFFTKYKYVLDFDELVAYSKKEL